jgi:hypothetical protein
MSRPRRIVTALRGDGLSHIALDEELEQAPRTGQPMDSGDRVTSAYPRGIPDVSAIWSVDELPAQLPWNGELPSGAHPGARGVRVSMGIYPPGWSGEMFWSNRLDILWVAKGELTYVTDSGDEVVVTPGDIVVQNGTNKSFHNRGSEDMWMGAVMLGATRVGETPPRDAFHGTTTELERVLEQRTTERSTNAAP